MIISRLEKYYMVPAMMGSGYEGVVYKNVIGTYLRPIASKKSPDL